jgi:hypothetical protein
MLDGEPVVEPPHPRGVGVHGDAARAAAAADATRHRDTVANLHELASIDLVALEGLQPLPGIAEVRLRCAITRRCEARSPPP